MDYTEAIIWYTAWPVLIFVAYKFVMLNLRHHAKMERLEMLEERFGEQCTHTDALLKMKNGDEK